MSFFSRRVKETNKSEKIILFCDKCETLEMHVLNNRKIFRQIDQHVDLFREHTSPGNEKRCLEIGEYENRLSSNIGDNIRSFTMWEKD